MAGISCHHSVKTRSVNFCLKQLKRPVYRLVERTLLTIRFGKQVSHGYLMVELQKSSKHSWAGILNLQSLSSYAYKSASITHERKMSDILQQQASRPVLSPNAFFKSKCIRLCLCWWNKLAAVFILPTKKLQLSSDATSFSFRSISKHRLNFQLCQ